MWQLVLRFVSDFRTTAQVCREWKHFLETPQFWRMLFRTFDPRFITASQGQVVRMTHEQIRASLRFMPLAWAITNEGSVSRSGFRFIPRILLGKNGVSLSVLKFLSSVYVYKQFIQRHYQQLERAWTRGGHRDWMIGKEYLYLYILGQSRYLETQFLTRKVMTRLKRQRKKFEFSSSPLAPETFADVNQATPFATFTSPFVVEESWHTRGFLDIQTRQKELEYRVLMDYVHLPNVTKELVFAHLFSRQWIRHAADPYARGSPNLPLILPRAMLRGLYHTLAAQRKIQMSQKAATSESAYSWFSWCLSKMQQIFKSKKTVDYNLDVRASELPFVTKFLEDHPELQFTLVV